MTNDHKLELKIWFMAIPILIWWIFLISSDWIWAKMGLLELVKDKSFIDGGGTFFFGLFTAIIWVGVVRVTMLIFTNVVLANRCSCDKCDHR